METLVDSIRHFLSELRRRDVYQVGVTYVVVGFFVIEAADLIVPRLGLPSWTVTLVITLVGLGFPIALGMAWALEMTPAGVRVEAAGEDGAGGASPPRSAAPEGSPRNRWVGASVLVLLLLGAGWLLGGLFGVGGAGGAASVSTALDGRGPRNRTVAVLPFEVSGEGTEAWRDGMVTMLSAGLDGAAGLRAIADRTVFAAWQQRDSTAASATVSASAQEALAVARSVGAEYAVLGSAVQLGGNLRLVAEVRRAGSGERLGQVEVQGAPEDVTALANRLARKVLGVLLGESDEQIPSVNLASITTSSLPALKAFLRGERHFRAGAYGAAIEDYEAAAEADSSFALAYARMAISQGWVNQEGGTSALRQAYRLSDRLPRREQRLIRARYLRRVRDRPSQAADSLRRLTDEYPGDPSMWYFLGETLYHGVPGGFAESEAAFQEAVRLDSGAAPYHHHLVDLAFKVHHDSAMAARRIEAHPDGARKRWYRALHDLVFGPPDQRSEAWARVDTLEEWYFSPVNNPLDWRLRKRLLRALAEQETGPFRVARGLHKLRGGRVDAARRQFPDGPQPGPSLALARAQTLGYPISDSLLRARVRPEELGPSADLGRLLAAGLYRVEQGRSEAVDEILTWLRRSASRPDVSGEGGSRRAAAVRQLEGYRAYAAGRLSEARKHWAERETVPPTPSIWRGDLYRQLGRPETAADWYQAAWAHPLAHERLGKTYEQMGRPDEAQAAYRRFIAAWENADPELQPRVEAARRRLRALERTSPAE
jgi:tetratricopeptide (TPR) repeat protein